MQLNREIKKLIEVHNSLFEKYKRLLIYPTRLKDFKEKRTFHFLKRSCLHRERVIKENATLTTLFWMLVEDKDTLTKFLYKVYFRNIFTWFFFSEERKRGVYLVVCIIDI